MTFKKQLYISGFYSFPEVIFYFFIIFFPVEFYLLLDTAYFITPQTLEVFKDNISIEQEAHLKDSQVIQFVNKNAVFQKTDIAIFIVLSFSVSIFALSVSTVFFKVYS
jgi:hypothetical protein